MVDLTVFDGFVGQGTPLSQEVSVFHINPGRANKIITKQVVVVHNIDTDRWAAREDNGEIVVRAKIRIGLIKDVVVTLVEFLFTARNLDVRVGSTTSIA